MLAWVKNHSIQPVARKRWRETSSRQPLFPDLPTKLIISSLPLTTDCRSKLALCLALLLSGSRSSSSGNLPVPSHPPVGTRSHPRQGPGRPLVRVSHKPWDQGRQEAELGGCPEGWLGQSGGPALAKAETGATAHCDQHWGLSCSGQYSRQQGGMHLARIPLHFYQISSLDTGWAAIQGVPSCLKPHAVTAKHSIL